MEFRVYSDKPSSVCLEFLLGTNSYRLFRNFVKRNATENPDTSMKMMFASIDNQMDSPQVVSTSSDAALPTTAQQMAISSGQANLSGAITNLSQKLDLVIKSLAGLQNKSDALPKEIKFDVEILDGYAKRIDGTFRKVLQEKLPSFDGTQDFVAKIDDLGIKINDIKKTLVGLDAARLASMATTAYTAQVSSINVLSEQAAHTQAPIITTSEALCQKAENAEVAVLGKKEDTSQPEDATVGEKPSSKAVVGVDIIRYPATTKAAQPKCFGNFLPKDQDPDSPCKSCVYVNGCKDKKGGVKEASASQQDMPSCFGKHRHDLDCSVCKVSPECQEESS